MATDATGTPTSPDNIPTYNVNVDKPSGAGFNAAMAAIQTALDGHADKPASIATGEVPVWNGSAWARSSVTKIGLSSLTDPGSGKVIGSSGGAAAAVIPPGTVMAEFLQTTQTGPTGVTATTSGGDALATFPSNTYPVGRYHFDLFLGGLQTSSGARIYFGVYRNDGTTGLTGWQGVHSVAGGINYGSFFVQGYFDFGSEITETLKLRWGSDGSGSSYTLTNGGGGAHVLIARIKRGNT